MVIKKVLLEATKSALAKAGAQDFAERGPALRHFDSAQCPLAERRVLEGIKPNWLGEDLCDSKSVGSLRRN